MSSLDIIEIPGYPGMFTRRVVVEMWQNAGSPHINDAGRLFSSQLDARLAFENGTGSPADDPRRPDLYPLAHVRFAALDVVNSARPAMIAAGFQYPYSYEPWHAQLPNIYSYPLVAEIPSTAGLDATPLPIPAQSQEDDDMYAIRQDGVADSGIIIRGSDAPYTLEDGQFNLVAGTFGLKVLNLAKWQYDGIVNQQWIAFDTNKKLLDSGVDRDDADAIIAGVKAAFPDAPKA